MSAAFVSAERSRRYRKGTTPAQRRRLEQLAGQLGIEVPAVAWRDEASDAITRLERLLRQPALGGVA